MLSVHILILDEVSKNLIIRPETPIGFVVKADGSRDLGQDLILEYSTYLRGALLYSLSGLGFRIITI